MSKTNNIKDFFINMGVRSRFTAMLVLALLGVSATSSSVFAMPMGTLSCDFIGGSAVRIAVSGASTWGGLLGGVGESPAVPGDEWAELEGEIAHTTAEADAGTTTFIFGSLTPSTTYTFTLELSDSTVVDTVDCTTSGAVHAVDADLRLHSVNGSVIDVDNDYYSSARLVPEGATLVYRYYLTNISPVIMAMSGNNAIDVGSSPAFDYNVSFTDANGSSQFDSYIGGDTNTDNNLDPGETWVLEKTVSSITQAYEDQDSSDLIGDSSPDTAAPQALMLAFNGGADLEKHTDYEFLEVGVPGCIDSTAQNYDSGAEIDDGSCQFADLALRKTTSSSTVTPGQDITFTIDIYNQADVDAYQVEIADYIPAGLTLSTNDTNGWVESGGMATVTLPGSIASGGNTSIDIVLTVDDPWTMTDFILLNHAEIKSAEDSTTANFNDVDSTADMTESNDCGAEVNTSNDDRLTGDAMAGAGCDEDDHDVEDVTVTLGPAIDIEKLIGAPGGEQFDADTEAARVAVATGADVTITILVTNTGSTDLMLNGGQPTVDAACTNLTLYDQGDNDSLNILSQGEVWTYTCVVEDVFDPGTCGSSVVANPVFPDGSDIPGQSDVTDSDPVFLDIGGSLFGATVTALADTGTGIRTMTVSGLALVAGSLYMNRVTGRNPVYEFIGMRNKRKHPVSR